MNECLVKVVQRSLKKLPLVAIEPLSRTLSSFVYPLLVKRRRIALANLDLAFGHTMSLVQKEKILRQNLFWFTRSLWELGKSLDLSLDFYTAHFSVHGEEQLKTTYARGKGVIIVSAHMGNFPLMSVFFALKGYKVGVVAKTPRKGFLAQVIEIFQKKLGIIFIQARENREAVRLSLKHLRQGGMLFLLLDQNAPRHRAMVNFFGHPVPTPRSPILLAQRTEAPVVPLFSICEPGLRHRVFIEPPINFNHNQGKEEVLTSLSRLMQIIETYVRRYPDQWWWWHRRWKEHIDYERL
ncbi:MAG: lysophospholipid acyltransferase family protein [Candidatus Desulfofervidaceae bacterium]|nr:lysophospholipid acyltransferase family protein [Candidatus Desulfofervidaceae bacterium]